MDMIKAGVIGVVGVLLAVSLKSHKAEYSAYVALAVCFVMLEYIMRYFMQILEGMETLRGYLWELPMPASSVRGSARMQDMPVWRDRWRCLASSIFFPWECRFCFR